MERGSGFHRYRSCRHAKLPATPSSANNTSLNLQVITNAAGNFPKLTGSSNGNDNDNDNSTMALLQDPRPGSQSTMREQDQYMPIANVIRIMRRILPAHAKISDDAKETIQECVSEYISFITGEANDRCQREQRKTITAEDVLWAMGKLGFDDYVEPLSVFISRYRDSENERTSVRDPILKRNASSDYGNYTVPSYGSVYPINMGNHPGIYDPAGLGGYYRNASGGAAASSSQNPLANFDPFAQLK